MAWKRDRGLSFRIFLTWILLGMVYLFFLFVLTSLGYGYSIMLPFIGLMLFAQYFFSDKIVLMATRAKVVTENEAPELHSMVRRLVGQAGLPMPRVAIMETSVPNAFATGRNPKNAVVAVTTGLMKTLNRDELEAVIGHELSHIKNKDVRAITVASFLSTVAFFLMRWGMFMGMFGSRRGNSAAPIVIFAVSALVWLISFLLVRALSRYREFAADAGSVAITNKPDAMISALKKISGKMEYVNNDEKKAMEGMNAFFIIPSISKGSIISLFSTHPPIEKRIERISEMYGV